MNVKTNNYMKIINEWNKFQEAHCNVAKYIKREKSIISELKMKHDLRVREWERERARAVDYEKYLRWTLSEN